MRNSLHQPCWDPLVLGQLPRRGCQQHLWVPRIKQHPSRIMGEGLWLWRLHTHGQCNQAEFFCFCFFQWRTTAICTSVHRSWPVRQEKITVGWKNPVLWGLKSLQLISGYSRSGVGLSRLRYTLKCWRDSYLLHERGRIGNKIIFSEVSVAFSARRNSWNFIQYDWYCSVVEPQWTTRSSRVNLGTTLLCRNFAKKPTCRMKTEPEQPEWRGLWEGWFQQTVM